VVFSRLGLGDKAFDVLEGIELENQGVGRSIIKTLSIKVEIHIKSH